MEGFASFIGTTVVGERGQVVIPKEARNTLKLTAGEKLVVMLHPKCGLILVPVEMMKATLQSISEHFTDLKQVLSK